jgi:hypothetical protein
VISVTTKISAIAAAVSKAITAERGIFVDITFSLIDSGHRFHRMMTLLLFHYQYAQLTF